MLAGLPRKYRLRNCFWLHPSEIKEWWKTCGSVVAWFFRNASDEESMFAIWFFLNCFTNFRCWGSTLKRSSHFFVPSYQHQHDESGAIFVWGSSLLIAVGSGFTCIIGGVLLVVHVSQFCLFSCFAVGVCGKRFKLGSPKVAFQTECWFRTCQHEYLTDQCGLVDKDEWFRYQKATLGFDFLSAKPKINNWHLLSLMLSQITMKLLETQNYWMVEYLLLDSLLSLHIMQVLQ